ncbi:hypothetical protein, partial [Pseudomonas syringae group genomosp. 3]|uniref:hypothetical protein n=1 Tax=Pseudomonas syringae group genomosp. 3 TaxID=251701 RepID=UPI001F41CBF9
MCRFLSPTDPRKGRFFALANKQFRKSCLLVKNDAEQLHFHQQPHAEGAIFHTGHLHGNIVVEIRWCVVVVVVLRPLGLLRPGRLLRVRLCNLYRFDPG